MKVLPQGDPRAALHYEVLNDPEASPEAIEAAIDWLEETKGSKESLEHIGRFMRACDRVIESLPVAEIDSELHSTRPLRNSERRRAWQVAASLAVAATGGTLFMLGHERDSATPRTISTEYATKIGEVRSVSLPDRSTVVLGGATAIAVSYGPNFRRVSLASGEALFKVRHAPTRPFVVESGSGTVRALGTQFDVHRSSTGTTVTVIGGSVNVTARSADRLSVARLRQDMQVTYLGGQMAGIILVDARRIADWQGGILRFLDQPLAAVIADLNRYSPRPIIVEDKSLSSEHITATVRTDAILEWLHGLAETSGLTLGTSDRGAIILRSHDPSSIRRIATAGIRRAIVGPAAVKES